MITKTSKSKNPLGKIKQIYGKNKIAQKSLEEVFYNAIPHYPGLKNTYYFVVNTKFYGIQHTLRAYPPLFSLFSKRKNILNYIPKYILILQNFQDKLLDYLMN
jgi:hypothetical protein